MKRTIPIVILSALLAVVSCKQKEQVDTIIVADSIYLCDSSFKTAGAIAISEGNIIDIGTEEEISAKYVANEQVKQRQAYVYPGFIDAHCHFSGYGLTKYMCNLIGTISFEEVLERLKEYEKTNQLDWIYARGWDQNDWENKNFPDKTELDKLFPDKPVILKRVDGHAVLCNQKALDIAGINKNTKISGGIINIKDGKPTGILIDNATGPVEKIIPELTEDVASRYLKQAEDDCFSLGLTGVVDCGVKSGRIKVLESLYNSGKLTIGNSILLSQDKETLDEYAHLGFVKNGQFQINGIKMYADGALGSRGACLLEQYSDEKDHYGLMLSKTEEFRAISELAKAYQLQLCTHAIGDSANRAILRLYSEFLPKTNDFRWRIEHAQVIDYQDYVWFSEYNIVPSVQPTHAISDMPWAGNRLGEKRLPTAYAYKKLLEQNGWLPLGTDFPVEGLNPLATFYTAVARKDFSGFPENGFMIENALTRQEALLGMTIWAAKSVFWEKEKGSIEIGKAADLVILDRDIMNCDEKDIMNSKVLYTIVKGKTVYKK
ncbi:MAG: amidohydrolase [Chitinophagales bacterium]|nr:amidohydrolase [Chitinophagales bacterium]